MKLKVFRVLVLLVLAVESILACDSQPHEFDPGQGEAAGSGAAAGAAADATAGATAGAEASGGATGGTVSSLGGEGMLGAGAPAGGAASEACAAGAERPCKDEAGQALLGNCAKGSQTCAAGVWSECSVTAEAADTCVASDDADCDGTPNEGCPCVDGTTQPCGPPADVGICRRGTQTCAAKSWGQCVGAISASARDCTSSADNDCDGQNDNTLDAVCKCAAGGSQSCDSHAGDGKGRCKAGEKKCVVAPNKQSSEFGACTGAVGPLATDACTPLNDDNCNGVANEGCSCVNGATQVCGTTQGICKAGKQTCTNAKWGACDGVLPGSRDCTSGQDNDCNGTPDNADTTCACSGAARACNQHPGKDGVGPCKAGTEACLVAADKKSSSWSGSCVGFVDPAPKDSCNAGNDADCSGAAGDSCSCINGGVVDCGSCTKKTCAGGSYGACVSSCSASQSCVSNVCKSADCTGKACGAADGVGGVCQTGSCAQPGTTCKAAECGVWDVKVTCSNQAQVAASWNFVASTEGWAIDEQQTQVSLGLLNLHQATITGPLGGPISVMALDVASLPNSPPQIIVLKVQLCPGSSFVSHTGKSLVFDLRFATASGTLGNNNEIYATALTDQQPQDQNIASGWNNLSFTGLDLTNEVSGSLYIGIRMWTVPWGGTIYFDNMHR